MRPIHPKYRSIVLYNDGNPRDPDTVNGVRRVLLYVHMTVFRCGMDVDFAANGHVTYQRGNRVKNLYYGRGTD